MENFILFKSFIRRLFEALKVLTLLGVSHNDIKMDNILVDQDSALESLSVKIIDFGSCSFREDNVSQVRSTPEYMSPEALASLPQDGL
jgi:serine/threonine protein kinase